MRKDKRGHGRLQGRVVNAPLIKECLANIGCRVVEIIRRHDIVVLDRRRQMAGKLPEGV